MPATGELDMWSRVIRAPATGTSESREHYEVSLPDAASQHAGSLRFFAGRR